jgi:threonine dehydrogenase-like Zn-dependent dehydrogenase
MKALTVVPLKAGSALVEDVDEPAPEEGEVLVETIAVGVCGTDAEIVAGDYGWAPPGKERLVLGHESLGRVLESPEGCAVAPGDHVVCIVRRPDPVPCYACAAGQWDFCRNGRYTEHGIKSLDGFMRERYRTPADALVRIDNDLGLCGVLLEPTTIVAKAWEEIEDIGHRAVWKPETVLVTGAGPVGLLASLLGKQRGLEVHVLDHLEGGAKPRLVEELGATYHTGPIAGAVQSPDVIIEGTGVPELVIDSIRAVGPGGVVALLGVGAAGATIPVDVGALNRDAVLANKSLVGSVNANRSHYQKAVIALHAADDAWLSQLITKRLPLAHFADALQHGPDDVKTVMELSPVDSAPPTRARSKRTSTAATGRAVPAAAAAADPAPAPAPASSGGGGRAS